MGERKSPLSVVVWRHLSILSNHVYVTVLWIFHKKIEDLFKHLSIILSIEICFCEIAFIHICFFSSILCMQFYGFMVSL